MGNIDKVHNTHATKKERMLSDPDVRRWYDNMARGSVNTAEERVRRLCKFCEDHDMTPSEVVSLAEGDVRRISDVLEDYVTRLEEAGKAPGYIDNHVKTVKSWLKHFDIEIRRKIRIRDRQSTPTLKDEHVPDAGEMAEIHSRADLRAAVVISLIAKSGLRPEVIGNHDGSDGLRLADLPDLEVRDGLARAIRTPFMITVRPELSKASHRYFTFCTGMGSDYIMAYLNGRLARGEALGPDSPVILRIKPGRPSERKGTYPCLESRQISRIVRATLRPRFDWRPYVLRAYFDTQLLVAEARGQIAHDFRVFFMGHKGSIEARYTTNKGVLPDILLSEMRDAYTRAEPYLDQTGEEIRRREAGGVPGNGAPQAPPAGMGWNGASPAQGAAMPGSGMQPARADPGGGPRPSQIVTDSAHVRGYIAQGYRFVAILPDGQVILDCPD